MVEDVKFNSFKLQCSHEGRVVMLRKMLSIDVKSDNSVYGGPGMKELKIVLESPSVARHLLD